MAIELCRFAEGSGAARLGRRVDGGVQPLSGPGLGSLAEALTLSAADLLARIETASRNATVVTDPRLLAPIDQQEVWAAGVTYRRSREARMAESSEASIYDRVYTAPRPEIFYKANPGRTVGNGEAVGIRGDARWTVPESELALVVNRAGEIVGYTIGNDVTSRDIEGENPLYLPQAKIWDACCAVGPGIVLADGSLDPTELTITCTIHRGGRIAFEGSASTSSIVRPLAEIVGYVYRHNSFPHGCILLTGTGIVPPDEFALENGDQVDIAITGLGTLSNPVKRLS